MVTSVLPLTAKGIIVRRRAKRLLEPVDLRIETPGITALLGPNGAGKTTLLKALHGIERLSAGSVSWNLPARDAAQRQAFVFQTPIMLRRSVAQNLAYPLVIARTPRKEVAEKVNAWAMKIGLQDALSQPATRLSGGEKQKLALGRALIAGPEMIFLDEPCTNLDGRATREIETLLLDAHRKGTSLIMATHDLGQARRLADRVIFLHKGEILETGPADKCLSTPDAPQLRAYLNGDIVE